MREIKFKFWHKSLEKMMTWEEVSDNFYLSVFNYDVSIPLQYTGLNDKNGKEIYEGDIVKYKELIPSENKIQKIIQGADYVYLEFVGKVVWDEEGASFDVDGGNHGYRGFGARGSVEHEIIGNIYENTDLLNA